MIEDDYISEADLKLKNQIKEIEKEAYRESKSSGNWSKSQPKFEKLKAQKLLELCKEQEKKLNKKPVLLPQGYSPENYEGYVHINTLTVSGIKDYCKKRLNIDILEKKGIKFDLTLQAIKSNKRKIEIVNVFESELKQNKIPYKT